MRKIPAHIVVPDNAPAVKLEAMKGYGANIVLCKPTLADREGTCQRIMEEHGATLIHPYNHPDVMAGQGTLALELMQQVPHLDAIIAPVGGGGMLSGVCIAAKGANPKIKIFAAEPLGADDAAKSFASGVLVPQTAPSTIADGLRTSMGSLTWPVIKDNIEEVLTVTEDEIRAAMRVVWERVKIVIEPSSAVAVAAAIGSQFKASEKAKGCKRIGVVISGGNIDLDVWDWKLCPK
eukprot:TRINITY_DN2695_c0_g1_i2.p1 TRINITY_DN2695_c0_g1~~TRINITY_DN2695_c0_g1_i2.p1  ORF type:complete len:235 (-),score=64.99 TRINITY_DN2695_c0_g1_i2:296-1000(-)